jgi:hypothetical protein
MDYSLEILKCWKADNWPQLVFYSKMHQWEGSRYNSCVCVGNTREDILIPYHIEGNKLTVVGNQYTIAYIRKADKYVFPYFVHEMEWIDRNGNTIHFRELDRGETQVAIDKVKIPF